MPSKKPSKKEKAPVKKATTPPPEPPPVKKDTPPKAPSQEEMEEAQIDEEETESATNGDCKCVEDDGDYYCYKFRQGRWIQWSVVPYPTQKMCMAACCGKTGTPG